MQHFQSLDPVQLTDAWITIGSFDGVHLGHQQILKQLTRQAHAHHQPAVVITFFPHPAVVLGKGASVGYLTTPEERAELLGEQGVDVVVTIPFTHELAALSALEFMQLLCEHLGVRHLLVGYDFALGRGREGNVDRLREIGQSLGYALQVIDPVESEVHRSHPARSGVSFALARCRTLPNYWDEIIKCQVKSSTAMGGALTLVFPLPTWSTGMNASCQPMAFTSPGPGSMACDMLRSAT